jgi:protein-S-isoprenylcysteine O-methyltransferase Ste14
MEWNVNAAIGYAWDSVGLVWLAGYAFTKPAVRTQSLGTRLFHVALLALGGVMLGSQWFRYGWLAARFVPEARSAQIAGLAITIAGCLFAIWARLTLGGNWSARATVKAGHELVTSGPYALARHPIYTGLLLALAGTILAIGEWRCILGFAIIVFAFLVKMSQEERLMMQTFPEAYPRYRQHVKALIPGVL